jgi:hypothetical protein
MVLEEYLLLAGALHPSIKIARFLFGIRFRELTLIKHGHNPITRHIIRNEGSILIQQL